MQATIISKKETGSLEINHEIDRVTGLTCNKETYKYKITKQENYKKAAAVEVNKIRIVHGRRGS